jgi:hypothetical protein
MYQWFFLLTIVPQKCKTVTLGERNWLRGDRASAQLSLHILSEPQAISKQRICFKKKKKRGGSLTLNLSSPPTHRLCLLLPSLFPNLLFFSECVQYACIGGGALHMCVGIHEKSEVNIECTSLFLILYTKAGLSAEPTV